MDQSKECLGIPVSAHPASTVARYNEWIGLGGASQVLEVPLLIGDSGPLGTSSPTWPPPLIQTDRNILPMNESLGGPI